MPEFLELIPPTEALNQITAIITNRTQPEWVDLQSAWNRITYNPIKAPHPLPSFNRSTVDGYAVRAQDTFGASDSLPIYMEVLGEVKMGFSPHFDLKPDCCAIIHTGGMLPDSATAVVMLENTQPVDHHEIEIHRPVAEGENVLHTGEDVRAGEIVIPANTRLGPAEIGGLAALGINELQVSRKPRVAIISSGDEVIPPSEELTPGKVRDINTYTLLTLVAESGGVPVPYGILPDRMDAVTQTANQALSECDMVVFTAGSSASVRDLTAESISQLGKPGVIVHGVNVRPGKPTILAACQPENADYPKAVIGLPGNPVSALVIAGLFVKPIIFQLLGLPNRPIREYVTAELNVNLPSQAGREDWVPVKLSKLNEKVIAEPVFGKSNLIFTLVRADGLLHISADATGLDAGTQVKVYLTP